MIQKLTNDLINQVKSHSEISDLNECIIQLVNNSIDANSEFIRIQVDLNAFNILIFDNGIGMSEKDLRLIGENNVTSKLTSLQNFDSLTTFGYHGQALFNIIQLSHKVEIITRQKSKKNYVLKQFTRGQPSQIKPLDQYEKTFDHDLNTLISIENLFSHNELRTHQLRESVKRLANLIDKLEVLSLVYYSVEIILENAANGKCLFKSESSDSLQDQFVKFYGLKLGDDVRSYAYKEDQYEVNGCVNTYNKQNRVNLQASRLQFIYVNQRFVPDKELYDLVSKQLSSCRYFNVLSIDPEEMIFCLSIICPTSHYNVLFHNKKLIIKFKQDTLKTVLKNYIDSFLINFDYKRSVSKRNDQMCLTGIPSKILKYGREIYAEDLKYSRVSKVMKIPRKQKKIDMKTESISQKMSIQLNNSHFLNSKLFGEKIFKRSKYSDIKIKNLEKVRCHKNKSTQCEETPLQKSTSIEKSIVNLKPNWITQKKSNGVEFYLNLMDGYTTYDINEAIESPPTDTNRELALVDVFSMKLKKANINIFNCLFEGFNPRSKEDRELNSTCKDSGSTDKLNMNKILLEKNILVKWRNKEEFYDQEQCCVENFDKIGSKLIERSIFKNLKVIGQLDKKFIICYSSSNSKNLNFNSIFIFDQHGCHERIRLETIYKDNMDKFGNLKYESLKNPLEFKIQPVAEEIFETFKSRMDRFGLDLILDTDRLCLKALTLPQILFKRLKTDVDIHSVIYNMLINQLKESNSGTTNAIKSSYKTNAFSLIDIPIELIDMFNMEACRGAIKFGDELSKQRCEELIVELSNCQLPFQCAHGRPTVVPLTNIFQSKETKRLKLNFANLLEDEENFDVLP